MAITVRLARREDRDEIFRVHRDSVQSLCAADYSPEQIELWLKGRDPSMYLEAIARAELWVAVSEDVMLGLVEVDGSEVTKLFVSGAGAGSGVGRALMTVAIEHLRARGETCVHLESTTTARGFYQRLGFVETNRGTFSHGDSRVTLEIVNMERAVLGQASGSTADQLIDKRSAPR